MLNGTLLYRWQVGACSGETVDGWGALDCKCTMFTELQAVEELLEEGFRPRRDVYLVYSINEETGGDGTDCRHFHALTENALRFTPVRCTSAQSASCHGVDENVTITSLAEGAAFYKDFLTNFPD